MLDFASLTSTMHAIALLPACQRAVPVGPFQVLPAAFLLPLLSGCMRLLAPGFILLSRVCLRAVPVGPFQTLWACLLGSLLPVIRAVQCLCQAHAFLALPAPWILHSLVQLLLAEIDTSPKLNPCVLEPLLMPCLKEPLLALLWPRAWALALVPGLLLPHLLPLPAPTWLSLSLTRFLVTG